MPHSPSWRKARCRLRNLSCGLIFEFGFQGWVVRGNLGFYQTAPYASMNGIHLVAFNATLSQPFATIAGQNYTLEFDAGVIFHNTNTNSHFMQVTVADTGSFLSRTIAISGLGGWQIGGDL